MFSQEALLLLGGLDKAALSLCAARLCKLVLAEVVRDEVEENLLLHAERLATLEADELIEHYHRLVTLTGPDPSFAIRESFHKKHAPNFR